MFHVKPTGRPVPWTIGVWAVARIPEGWEYWCSGGADWDRAWNDAGDLKATRERLRPDLLCRVKVVKARGGYWILRREEPRQETAR